MDDMDSWHDERRGDVSRKSLASPRVAGVLESHMYV